MKEKFGVTGILFDEVNKKYFFLLLHRKLNWSGWEFVKGGIEPSEDSKQAVLREIKEETGLENVRLLCKVAGPIEWKSKDTKYTYDIFLLKANKNDKIFLALDIVEHDDFEWVKQERVEQMLTHNDNKVVFKKAILWLKEYGKSGSNSG